MKRPIIPLPPTDPDSTTSTSTDDSNALVPPPGKGWMWTDLPERCPNEWKCKTKCSCHKLSDADLAEDLASHYKMEGWIRKVPVR